jgi:hypothetical protein
MPLAAVRFEKAAALDPNLTEALVALAKTKSDAGNTRKGSGCSNAVKFSRPANRPTNPDDGLP